MGLTEQQQQVVDSATKRIIVLSCAGSGKTTVIATKIEKLWEQGVNPEQILALTFSNKASQEMKKRICRDNSRMGSKVNVKTFHAFGLEIIRKYSLSFGFTDKVKIAKTADTRNILREIMQYFGGNILEGSDLENDIKRRKSFEPVPPQEFADRIFKRYTEILLERNLVDMDDMIWLPVNFLGENANARKMIAEQYQYVFVDEYQDTNEGQNRLLNLITDEGSHICLVGDDDQAIYEWRGAKPEYIRKKAESGEYELMKLETNFRSQGGIINIANLFIGKNRKRVRKTIRAFRELTDKPAFFRFANEIEEAEFVAKTVSELICKNKFNPADIAVLVRNNEQADPIKIALKNAGIQYDSCEMDENAQYSAFINVLESIIDLTSVDDLSKALNFPDRCFDQFAFREGQQAYRERYGENCDFPLLEWVDKLYLSDISFEDCSVFRERYALITQLHNARSWKPTQVAALYLEYMKNKGYDQTLPDQYHFVLQVFDIAQNY